MSQSLSQVTKAMVIKFPVFQAFQGFPGMRAGSAFQYYWCHHVAAIKLKCWCLGIFESLSQLAAMLAAMATELPREHERSYPDNDLCACVKLVPILAPGAYIHRELDDHVAYLVLRLSTGWERFIHMEFDRKNIYIYTDI